MFPRRSHHPGIRVVSRFVNVGIGHERENCSLDAETPHSVDHAFEVAMAICSLLLPDLSIQPLRSIRGKGSAFAGLDENVIATVIIDWMICVPPIWW